MKKITILLLMMSAFIFAQDHQKFKVKYIITFNEIDLKQAYEIEAKIRKEFKDACKIKVSVNEIIDNNISYGEPTWKKWFITKDMEKDSTIELYVYPDTLIYQRNDSTAYLGK